MEVALCNMRTSLIMQKMSQTGKDSIFANRSWSIISSLQLISEEIITQVKALGQTAAGANKLLITKGYT